MKTEYIDFMTKRIVIGHPIYLNINMCKLLVILVVFCILFSTSLNKADLILATKTKLLFESNNLKSTVEGLAFQI